MGGETPSIDKLMSTERDQQSSIRVQSARVVPTNKELQAIIKDQLKRHQNLWHGLGDSERRRRRHCLADQLCRQAQLKYAEVIVAEAKSWGAYLQTTHGYRRVT